tara:strand:+ start:2047 stop:2634 length:588 start_codon:yes stop_codon:yes gene_type:complete
MIPKGLFTQIAMIILSVGILIFYVQPAFSEIGKVQDKIGVYQTERKKVVEVNSRLDMLNIDLESVSREDQLRLVRYLPDSVDPISVSRDLALITLAAGVLYQDVSYGGLATAKQKQQNSTDGSGKEMPIAHSFTLGVEGAYPQIKTLFRLIEQNDYPLEVHGVDLKQNDGGFLTVSLQIVTYEFKEEIADKEIIF